MRAGPLIIAALALAGCGHRATVQQRDGARVEGVIVGGDGQYLVLDPTSASRRRLPRREAHDALNDAVMAALAFVKLRQLRSKNNQ